MISLHIVGMYFFSPLVGWLVDRLPVVLMVGAFQSLILFLGAEMASHTDPEDSLGVFVGLLLVGISWSFAMISGEVHRLPRRSRHRNVRRGRNADFTMVASGATILLSGVIIEAGSYHALSHWAAVLALSLVAAALYRRSPKPNSETPHG